MRFKWEKALTAFVWVSAIFAGIIVVMFIAYSLMVLADSIFAGIFIALFIAIASVTALIEGLYG